MELIGNPGKLKELKEEADIVKQPLKDIIRKSFDHHDIDKNGKLSAAESQAFFKHFVDRFVPFTTSVACNAMDKAVAVSLDILKGMMGSENDATDQKAQVEAQIAAAKTQIIEQFKAKGEAYASDNSKRPSGIRGPGHERGRTAPERRGG